MTDQTMAEILAGGLSPREEMHRALDGLLDALEDQGKNDPVLFWAFIADLAEVCRVPEELAAAAALQLVSHGSLPDNPEQMWRAAQWAYLWALLTRIGAFPGSILPEEFSTAAFRAVAHNAMTGRTEAKYLDLLGAGTQTGTERAALEKAARGACVGAVFYQAEKLKRPATKIRAKLFPATLHKNTWADWLDEAALAQGVTTAELKAQARAAARGEVDPVRYDLDDQTVKDLFQIGWQPNGREKGLAN